ncbi:MAG: hypothetical protein M1370_01280 [Bacteroidetes bacterium]|nr:hypothetical protein [Bacteroidota bacterium]MCL5027374.1 hypothetical protein [Chloroflexota bacterium]
MSDRAVVLFGALTLLSVVVLGAVLYALPGEGIGDLWQAPQPSQEPGYRSVPSLEQRRALAARPESPLWYRDRSPRLFWIRPFGLHSAGLEGIGWYATSFGILLISSFVTSFVFPRQLKTVSDALRRQPRRSLWFLLLGLIAYATLGLLVTLLFLNFTTIVLLLLVLPALLLATLLGLVAVELWIGQVITRWGHIEGSSALMELLVGVVLLFLVSSIPYAGWAAVGIAAAIGFGALLYTRFGSGEEWSLGTLEA